MDSTSNKTVKQTVHLSSKPFFNLLTAKDDMTDNAILDGIANILATAQQLNETDKVTIMVANGGGFKEKEIIIISCFGRKYFLSSRINVFDDMNVLKYLFE